ncbi:MAG TPA: FKBP-type peptidyl-prolyl cis-trans isomerase [Anaeromyxobacteraceae bacterium]|nr:FKBP-type peptidyl-prolyl cis-trans isomerase [Anaeromyxobacteraceae bacterium]
MRPAVAVAVLALAAPAFAAGPELKTDEDKTLYALGVMASRSFAEFNLTPKELEIIERGMTDALTGKKLAVDVDAYQAKVQEFAQKRIAASGQARASKEKGIVENYAKEKGAEKTASGLVYISLREGSGTSPKASDKVKVNYEGKLTDGKVFDSSYKRGQPVDFTLNQVIPCWTEGVAKMKPGGKAKLVCPPAIAYGERGAGGGVIPPNATLVFEVELLEVSPGEAAPAK